ncbi:MAG: GFA family protein [Candidatus Binatia bacterium]
MLKGSCLCGGVQYEIDGELGAVTNCHCSLCRKMSGSAFASGATIPATSFRFIAGTELLKEWQSSPGNHRVFCGRCGSPILKRKDKDVEHVRFRPGTLDSDPGVKISKHMHVSSKAPWVEIKDGLPQSE